MGSSGGGGSSGKVDFPEYMKTWHGEFLGTGTATIDLTSAMNSAMSGVSPYSGFVGVDVDDAFLGSGKTILSYAAPFAFFSLYADDNWAVLVGQYKSSNSSNSVTNFLNSFNAKMSTMISTEDAIMEADLNTTILPKYKAGMRNVNAAMSSAFAIGEAIIRASKTRDISKMSAVMNIEALKYTGELALKNESLAMEYATKVVLSKRDVATTAMDFAKLYVTARSEIDDANVEMAAKDRLWDLKVFQYGGNFLGSIAGSAVSTDKGDGKSKIMSTASGAVGGAAMGAMIGASYGSSGGPYGAAIGAVLGAAYGYFSG